MCRKAASRAFPGIARKAPGKAPDSVIKTCRDCGTAKPLDEFPPVHKNRDGRGPYCRPCMRVRHRTSRDTKRGGPPTRIIDRRPIEERAVKWCAQCQQDLPVSAFGRNRSNTDGLTAYCKPCHSAVGKLNRERLHGSTRDFHLKRRYGITSEQFDALVAAQGGHCALCWRPAQHVDHDHRTGEVRGALCSGCNQGLGNFRDDPVTLRAAARYLEQRAPQRRQEAAGVWRVLPPRRPLPAEGGLVELLARRRQGRGPADGGAG